MTKVGHLHREDYIVVRSRVDTDDYFEWHREDYRPQSCIDTAVINNLIVNTVDIGKDIDIKCLKSLDSRNKILLRLNNNTFFKFNIDNFVYSAL